jgi:hypothetical protein
MTVPEDLTQAGTVFYQQWPIVGGQIRVEIRTNRTVLGDEFIEVGKVMGEVERLAEMLADRDSEAAPTTKER